jgi:nucleotide-binding universal stress UspA family protein
MYRSILVPLDGLPSSEQALPIASAIADRCGATIHLAHVHTLYGPIISIDGLPVIDDQLRSLARDHDLAYLERTRERLQSMTSSPVACALLEPTATGGDEHIPALLTRHAAAIQSDLIVMGTRALGPLLRLLVGGVTTSLGRASGIPTLVAQARDHQTDLEPNLETKSAAFRRILIALDGSTRSEHILRPVVRLGKLTGAEYVLLHVVKPRLLRSGAFTAPVDLDPAGTARRRDEAEQALARLAASLRSDGATVTTRVVGAERRSTAIVETARQEACDLIAMAVRERRGLTGLLSGSVSNRVLRKAGVPVLLYHPRVRDERRGRRVSGLSLAPYYRLRTADGKASLV